MMRAPLRQMIIRLVMMFIIGCSTAIINTSYAQDAGSNLMTTDGNGGTTSCRDVAPDGKLLGVIVPCVVRTMERATQNFSAKMIATLDPLLYTFLTLAVILFGVKVLSGGAQHGGVGRLKGESFILILKIGLIIGLLQMVPTFLVPATYEIMNESQSIVVGAFGSDDQCVQAASTIWMQLDCVLGKLYGFTTGAGGKPNMLLMSSAFGFLGGFLFGGAFGVALFLACVGVLWSLFMIVLRTAVIFMNGYLYACVMLILSPVFMPLMLLRVTQPYFQSWWRSILASMILPTIVTAYAMFAMLLYDRVLFAPDSELQKIFDPSFAQRVQNTPRQPLDWSPVGNADYRGQASGQSQADIDRNPLVRNETMPWLNGANNPFSGFLVPDLGMTKDDFKKMFRSAIKVFITSMVISAGFKTVMAAANRFIGSQAVGSMVRVVSPIDAKFGKGIAGMKHGMMETFKTPDGGSASGTEFVKRIPTIPTNVMKGFFNGMSKD